ncbi:MAG: hypothetical protein IJC18_00110 [Clostridia bacterium]|nr:hypothetical protein [Clostridia bacterium]
MGKILGSWSGMRKYLEQEMLADSLKGRVRYGCTAYAGMDGCRIFEFCVDGEQVKRFSWETVKTYFIEKGCKNNSAPYGVREYWDEFWALLREYPICERTEYTDEEFCDALERYRNQSIEDSLASDNPIVRMFAILDRRVGKRTLLKLRDTVQMQPDWLGQIYRLRLSSEGIE